MLVFGAIPATLFCGFAGGLSIFGLVMLPSPVGFLMVLFGGAGVLGTYSLWMVFFGFWSRFIVFGLVAGILAMLPALISFELSFTALPLNLVRASPIVVAISCLVLSPKATHGEPRTFRDFSKGGIAIVASLVIPILALFAPVWATPLARMWYEPGFEQAVTKALAEIPGSENACIYDDSQNRFVTSVDQLDVGRMIEKSVQDNVPRPRFNSVQRDPHFRVYSGGRTYYWSFRDERLHAFGGNRWTLAGRCAYESV